MSMEEDIVRVGVLPAEALVCHNCDLCKTRHRIVFGDGSLSSKIMAIGESPGEDEDVQGIPFIGRSGKLLRRTLSLIGFNLENIFITNIIQCRPPNNRDPTKEEIAACKTWLDKKLSFLNPEMIITVGKFSTSVILGLDIKFVKITKMSGNEYLSDNRKIFPLVHPSFVLRGGITNVEYLIQTAAAYNYAISRGIV
jgi:uracil-DNA glycosylase family 4